jgi:hypothetical protein
MTTSLRYRERALNDFEAWAGGLGMELGSISLLDVAPEAEPVEA